MFILLRIAVLTFTLLLVSNIVPGIEVRGIYPAVVSAIILGLLHTLIKPILILITLPVTILTFGLFIFIINTALFLCVASFVDGFIVDGWLPALLGSLMVSAVSWIFQKMIT